MILNITPVPKPRMVRSDAWKKRKCVLKYWEYKDGLNILANKASYKIGNTLENVTFVIPVPPSWSKKRKTAMIGAPHTQKPDLDNLIKAFQDCLCREDSHVHTINNVRKTWGTTGQIIISPSVDPASDE
ncbi:MAG: RusA family crossover junction endodeoxyribonuclease [Deltaproteobacteria bacterium]|jgi:Holliday junction resolvase RusA-like endonuclease|nr:RusA family crossover junction endodeoxyribonuclease [Deltaproteobacteria bacterium]